MAMETYTPGMNLTTVLCCGPFTENIFIENFSALYMWRFHLSQAALLEFMLLSYLRCELGMLVQILHNVVVSAN